MIRAEQSRWTQPSVVRPSVVRPSVVRPYVVRLGHLRVDVMAEDAEQARAMARRQLCLELPRLWDLIQAMEAERFDVRLSAPQPDDRTSSESVSGSVSRVGEG